jgi:hypothetical protein
MMPATLRPLKGASYICEIMVIGACLFVALNKLVPNRRLTVVLKCAILPLAAKVRRMARSL